MTAERDVNDVRLYGIVNITKDSFSDGGRYLAADAAIAHAKRLFDDGADVVDLGPASSHPDAESVTPDEEVRRLQPVMHTLRQEGIPFSIDSFHPQTQKAAAEAGAVALNDIQGFGHLDQLQWLREHPQLDLVVMHSVQRQGIATRVHTDANGIVDVVTAFFEERLAALQQLGVAKERLWLDPGMGFFLGNTPDVSVAVLRGIPQLQQVHSQVYISVSRKSFLRALADCDVDDVGPPTLAAELFALRQGARAIRTHDVGALRRAWAVDRACAGV